MALGFNYVPDIWEIDALYECCNAFYSEKGDDARCVSCPKPDLLRYVNMQSTIGRCSLDLEQNQDEATRTRDIVTLKMALHQLV